jgi:type I restriction enzyme S subunit
MATQHKLRDLHCHTQALRNRHIAIRQANAALLSATLERVFSGGG